MQSLYLTMTKTARLSTFAARSVMVPFSLAAASVVAAPYVEDGAIRWDDTGWYQVQSTSDYATVCEGGSFCEVADGTYHVINLSTGERWENLRVQTAGASGEPVEYSDGVSVSGNTISWQESGWHQVQSKTDFATLCEGGTECEVPDGTYIVINHDAPYRVDNVFVSAGGSTPPTDPPPAGDDFIVDGTRIDFQNTDWFQVQRADTYLTVCEGEPSCELVAGTYNVINHSSGERFDGVVLAAADTGGGTTTGGTTTGGTTTGETTTGGTTTGGTTTGETTTGGTTTGGTTTGGTTTGGTTTGGTTTGGTTTGGTTTGAEMEPYASGSEIILPDTGWYQVQSATNFMNVCEGVISSCAVADGLYNVINHSTGTRWDDIRVGAAPAGPAYRVNPVDPFNAMLELDVSAAPASGMPGKPEHLRVELIAHDWVEFNWTPSSDDGEVVAYNIYRDTTDQPLYVLEKDMVHPNGGVTAELNKFWSTSSFIDCNRTRFLDRVFFCNGGPGGEPARGPEPGASHVYYVSAVDDDGNESELSEPLAVQLYDELNSELQRYVDYDLMPVHDFLFDTNISDVSNFIDRYELVFDEEFDGAELDSTKWNTRLTWGPDVVINGEKQYFVDTLNDPDFGYDPFEFTGSTLKIVATDTPTELLDQANGQRFLSGALSTYDKFGFTYGYTESRMRVSGVYGALSSFYLYNRYPGLHGPEIDIAEYLGYNQYGDEDMFQTYHYRDTQYASNQQTRSSPTMNHVNESGALYSDTFHTFGALWEPGLVIWYIDGIEVKRLHGPQISRRQMNIISYLVTGSGWTQAPDEYVPEDDLVEMETDDIVNLPFMFYPENPLEFEIDYIKVWQLADPVEP